jgi:hypothetical protein
MILVMKTIGHNGGFRQPINRKEFGNKTRGQFSQKGKIP